MREHENESRLLASFDKNAVEEVQVRLIEWKCQPYIDIRIWYKPESGEGVAVHPTTKGIRLATELLSDLRSALETTAIALEDGPIAEIVQDERAAGEGSR